tara:strand:- start:628 stop:735 length:108 start_codon:yes stop_codon:yes gene_type:complete
MIKQEVIDHDKVLKEFVKKQKERIKKLKNKQKDKK